MPTSDRHVRPPEYRLSKGQKFAYGRDSRCNNLLRGAIGFMSIVFNVGLGMNHGQVGTLQTIDKISLTKQYQGVFQ